MNVLLLAACTGDPGEPTGPAETATVSVPTDIPSIVEEEQNTTSIELAEVERAIQDAIVRVATFDPSPVLEVYRDLAAGADEVCPSRFVSDGLDYWLDECTSGAGTWFQGYGLDDLVLDAGYGYQLQTSTVGGVGRVESADGQWMDLNGFVQLVESDDAYAHTEAIYVTGEFETNHPAAAGTWLADGLVPNLYLTSYDLGGIGRALVVDGTLQGLEGELSVVAFETAVLADVATGISDCGLEPAGTASAQLPDGSWVDVIFDPLLGPERVETADPSTCDGCGRVWQGPVEVGSACFDFSSWL